MFERNSRARKSRRQAHHCLCEGREICGSQGIALVGKELEYGRFNPGNKIALV
jgi:hypothetical protein